MGWWRWALVSQDGVAPSRMVGVPASVNLPLHHKVQKFSSGTGSPRWFRKKGRETDVVVVRWLWCYSNVICHCHSFTDLQVADRSAPHTRLNRAERLVRVNNSTASQPLNHDVGLRQHPTRHITSPSGPHVRRRLTVSYTHLTLPTILRV